MKPTATRTGLGPYLDRERAHVERALERAVASVEERLPADAAAAIRYGVTGGGKRLRPILCAAAYEACGGQLDDLAYDLAAALEMIHAYSLMHDDLPCMDDAALRRGRTTTHRAHGEDVTIRAGAALIPAAALHAIAACDALTSDPARKKRIVARLLEAAGAGGMVGGQWLDLRGEGEALDVAALTGLHRRKTGALLAASLVIGGIAAGASDGAERALDEYGQAIGLAFQIADDILDATASAARLGKNPSDAALDKSTYVALYGVEGARSRAEAEVERAASALDGAELDAPVLRALARYVVDREK